MVPVSEGSSGSTRSSSQEIVYKTCITLPKEKSTAVSEIAQKGKNSGGKRNTVLHHTLSLYYF